MLPLASPEKARRRRAMANQCQTSPPALFRLTDWWGRMTSGSLLSVTAVQKIVHLFLILCATLEIYKLSYVDSKFVN